MFFGNQTGGLLHFNGVDWKLKHLSFGNTVRSIIQTDERTFWGGVGNFGYIVEDSLNNFSTKSLRVKIPPPFRKFNNVEQIVELRKNLYLRTYAGIYIVKSDTIEVLKTEEDILGLFNYEDAILAQIDNQSLAYLGSDGIVPIPGTETYANDRLYVVLPYKNQHLFISRKQGFLLYDGRNFRPFQTEVADYIKQHKIYRGTYINENQIALATLSGGIVIINTDGSLHTIITEEDGLPTNIIYELYIDREENLWAATDQGLVKLLVNNPVTKLDERSEFGGIPTFIKSIGSTTYFGSTEGLFFSNSLSEVNKISELGRVYDGIKMGNKIVVTTSEGLYSLGIGKETLLSSTELYSLESAQFVKSGLIYGVNSDALYEIEIKSNESTINKLAPLPGSVQDLHVDREELWITTKNEGVFRYDLNGSLIKKYEVPLSEGDNYQKMDNLGSKLRLATDAGLFVHNPRLDSFLVDTTFNHPELTNKQVNRFRQCSDDEIWFRNNRKIKRAVFESGQWEIEEDPYRLIDEGKSITTIHCGEGDDVWFGGTAGIYHLSDPEWEYDYNFNTNVTGLLVHNDSLIYGGYGDPDKPIELSYEDNQLRFTYAAASYVAPEQNMYKVRLRGYDTGWSNWTSETEKDYTFIPEGTYTFEVQGRNVYHKTGTIDSLTFTVLPPWYRTWWAYGLYLLMIGGVLYGAHQFRVNRLLREQRIRNRIASDLHDEVSATLSSITYFAQAIRQTQNGGKSERFVRLISESASDAKEKITDIIWSIDPDNDDWVNLLSKCRRFASDLFESKDMDYDLDIDTDINRPLDIELRQHLWLIFKEMVVNAARHSGARKVDISFGLKGNTLRLAVQDNGKGIGEELDKKSGHGIKNIKKRAGKIGAELQLETDSEIGTRWIMTLTIP